MVEPALRPSLAGMFFDLNELAPAPLIQNEAGAARVAFPRTGDAQAEIASSRAAASSLNIASAAAGPGFAPGTTAGRRLSVTDAGDYLAARAWAQTTARSLLPARR